MSRRRHIFHAATVDAYCACANYLGARLDCIGNALREPSRGDRYIATEAHYDALRALEQIKRLIRLERLLWRDRIAALDPPARERAIRARILRKAKRAAERIEP